MMISAAVPDRQPSLFEALPATTPRRRRGRPPAALTEAPTPESAPVPVLTAERESPVFVYAAPVRVDAAALTNPELGDLVRALGEPSLAYLLVEALREARNRLNPGDRFDEGEEGGGFEPSPALLRALRTVQAELAEGE